MTVHVTIELTEDQTARLEALAARDEVTLPEYLRRMAEQQLRQDDQWRALIQEGLEVAETGRTFTYEEVVARAEATRDAEFRALVQVGIEEARRGELHDHADVMAEVEALIAAAEARKAG